MMRLLRTLGFAWELGVVLLTKSLPGVRPAPGMGDEDR